MRAAPQAVVIPDFFFPEREQAPKPMYPKPDTSELTTTLWGTQDPSFVTKEMPIFALQGLVSNETTTTPVDGM